METAIPGHLNICGIRWTIYKTDQVGEISVFYPKQEIWIPSEENHNNDSIVPKLLKIALDIMLTQNGIVDETDKLSIKKTQLLNFMGHNLYTFLRDNMHVNWSTMTSKHPKLESDVIENKIEEIESSFTEALSTAINRNSVDKIDQIADSMGDIDEKYESIIKNDQDYELYIRDMDELRKNEKASTTI